MISFPVLAAAAALALAACVGTGRPMLLPAAARYEQCEQAEFARSYQQALALLDQRRPLDALPLLRAAIQACPEHVPAHEHYQDTALTVAGEAADAMRAYYQGLPDRPDSPVPPFCRARLVDDDFSRLGLLEEALNRDPSFYFAYLARGRVQRALGRLDAARRDLELALAARPEHADSNLEMAGVLMDIGRFAEAESYFSNYVAARPADRLAAKAYAQLLLYRLNRVDAAERVLQRLRAEDAEDPAVMMDSAAVAWRRGEFAAAVAGYQGVLALDRTRTRAALNLGNLYFELARRETGAQREATLRKARKAYRYFLDADRPEGMHDALDALFTVPHRLDEIAAVVGADDADAPAPGRNF